jgi:hypothetical protein
MKTAFEVTASDKPTADITVKGKTRNVELFVYGDRATVFGVVGTIGNGTARYPADIMLWDIEKYPTAAKKPYHTTDSNGTKWAYDMGTMIRNRPARVVGWTDEAGVTNYHHQERAQ